MPGVTLRLLSGLTETDTFTTRVYPRNEFVHTGWIKDFLQPAVTAPPPARATRVSRNSFVLPLHCFEFARLKSSSSGASGCDPGGTQKLIKEDHFRFAHEDEALSSLGAIDQSA